MSVKLQSEDTGYRIQDRGPYCRGDTGYRIGVIIAGWGYRIQDRGQYCKVGIQDKG